MKKSIFLAIVISSIFISLIYAEGNGKLYLDGKEYQITTFHWDSWVTIFSPIDGENIITLTFLPIEEDHGGIPGVKSGKNSVVVSGFVHQRRFNKTIDDWEIVDSKFDSDSTYFGTISGPVAEFTKAILRANRKIKEARNE